MPQAYIHPRSLQALLRLSATDVAYAKTLNASCGSIRGNGNIPAWRRDAAAKTGRTTGYCGEPSPLAQVRVDYPYPTVPAPGRFYSAQRVRAAMDFFGSPSWPSGASGALFLVVWSPGSQGSRPSRRFGSLGCVTGCALQGTLRTL